MPVSTAANSDTFKVTTPADREIVLSRLFDAPRRLVWEAMTKPEHIKRWWGNLGEGYDVPVCEVDLRVGGSWRFSNRMPSGELATFYGTYHEIAPPDRIVFTEIFEPYPDSPSTVTAVFTEENGKTRMTVTAEYASKDVRDMVLSTGMERGAALSYDHLEEVAMELARKQ
jgi:uncharacterized protein YndB with AHSA1/START domain